MYRAWWIINSQRSKKVKKRTRCCLNGQRNIKVAQIAKKSPKPVTQLFRKDVLHWTKSLPHPNRIFLSFLSSGFKVTWCEWNLYIYESGLLLFSKDWDSVIYYFSTFHFRVLKYISVMAVVVVVSARLLLQRSEFESSDTYSFSVNLSLKRTKRCQGWPIKYIFR